MFMGLQKEQPGPEAVRPVASVSPRCGAERAGDIAATVVHEEPTETNSPSWPSTTEGAQDRSVPLINVTIPPFTKTKPFNRKSSKNDWFHAHA